MQMLIVINSNYNKERKGFKSCAKQLYGLFKHKLSHFIVAPTVFDSVFYKTSDT